MLRIGLADTNVLFLWRRQYKVFLAANMANQTIVYAAIIAVGDQCLSTHIETKQ